MKKLIVGLFSATLMTSGVVAFSASSADAACPYTGCVDTTTKVSASDVEKGEKATICVKVTTGGSGQPKGRVELTVRRQGANIVWEDSSGYDGRTCFTTRKLNKVDTYVARVRFDGRGAFKNSNDAAKFEVTR